ncbi:CapA family protein [uncultured Faecalibaculum sp.]|uniref:CapA family protein n=1 Tax=uncultured Faecalibaculum sp. TaxID=1729681 RepID=UPI002627A4DA|nr:CapA family protein [uncultured Faecalibaculum sp.]
MMREKTGKHRYSLLCAALCLGLAGCTGSGSGSAPVPGKAADQGEQTAHTASFTFTGVGDNLLHDTLFVYHEQDTGNRDYSGMYSEVTPYFQKSDLSYINFETPCAGDAFGLSGYPSFNGPLEMIDTLAGMGLNWFSTSSNHSMDAGADGLLAEMAYVNEKYPGIFYTGTYPDAQSQNIPAVMEINGIRVGLASFTYGLNGYVLPEDKPWLVNVFVKNEETGEVDYDLMDRILDPLIAQSDVQIVSMHWGVEYQNQPNDMQKAVAQYLHDKGVEAVIGSHPHVIQPAEIIKSADQETLVYYSLGNFISGQDQNYTMVGGMAQFTMNYNFDAKKATITDPSFTPTVTWISSDLRRYNTQLLQDYTDDEAASQYVTLVQGQDCSRGYVKEYVEQVMGQPEGIRIVTE